MINSRPRIRLAEVLKPVSRPERVDPEKTYRILGAHWYAEGLYVKDTLSGSQIRADNVFRVEEGDFVYNRLFAWKGSFAVATDANAGCYVSNEFPCFEINRERADPKFLWRYFSRVSAWDEALGLSTGGTPTSRNRLKEEKFLAMEIPLPMLPEQQRIVARIGALAAQIHEVQSLREQAAVEGLGLLFSCCESLLREAETRFPCRPLGELVEKERGISYGIVQTGVHLDGGIPTVRAGDLRWFHCNTLDVKQVEPGIEHAYQRTRLSGGELLLRIRGGVGELAVCPRELVGGNVSREIAVIPLTEDIDSRYAMFMLAAPTNQERMSGHVKGTSYVGINLQDVRTLDVPVPPLSEQRRIVAQLDSLQAEADKLKKLQAESASELDALLPSILDHAFKGDL
jgi:type I restriction enzyme S subunit